METQAPCKEVTDIIRETGGEAFKLCYQCGTCTATCPWNTVASFPPRHMLHQAQLGLSEFESEDVWRCVTCNACVKRCPRGVEIIDVMRALRRSVAGLGLAEVPLALRLALKNISGVGNPLGEPADERAKWAAGLDAKAYTAGMEALYLPCCIPAYDTKVKRVAVATAEVLKQAGVSYGIGSGSESCCGESVRKSGDEDLFQRLSQNNIGVFKAAGATRLLVSSPHCYHSFKNDYPEQGGSFEVEHTVQLFDRLIKAGHLKFSREVKKRVTYHDPCYLGRHNGVYDAPRAVLSAIPGLELVEMADSREYSLCCGGGGGRIWMETRKEERFSGKRLEQALEVGAEVLAVACPYCMSNLDDAVLTGGHEGRIAVMDVAELVKAAL